MQNRCNWDQGLDNTGNLVTNLQEVGDILNIVTQVHHNTPISDAKRFNANNIPAICGAWDYYKPRNHPHLHTAQDTTESVNIKVLTEATRLLAAASHQIANKISLFC